MENLDPPPPKSRMGKWRVFALRLPSSLIWGDGGLLFHFILSKIVAKKNKINKIHSNQGLLKHFSHSQTSCKKMLLLYIFHWSFIHVLIVSHNFARLYPAFFPFAYCVWMKHEWDVWKWFKCGVWFAPVFILTKKKECIRFVEYFNDRLITLPDLTSSTHLAALFKTHNTQRAVCVDYKIREFKIRRLQLNMLLRMIKTTWLFIFPA